MIDKKEKIKNLSDRLGHEFADLSLLKDALTHPSLGGVKKKNSSKHFSPYERLEFLGDRVLGLVIAEWLYEIFPDAKEGELAKRHAALVNRDALRDVAQNIGLDEVIRLAHGEEVGQGRKNLAAMSDAMEAVIGSLYLDGGLKVAETFIRRYWEGAIHRKQAPMDPKTALQEWAQGKGLPLPSYEIISRTGPAHAPHFVIEANVKGFDPARAEGNSKREAEKEAAKKLLEDITKK